jgi:hypothetical protein
MTNPTVAFAILQNTLKSLEFYIHNSAEFFEDPGVDGRIILRWIFRNWDGSHGLDLSGTG